MSTQVRNTVKLILSAVLTILMAVGIISAEESAALNELALELLAGTVGIVATFEAIRDVIKNLGR